MRESIENLLDFVFSVATVVEVVFEGDIIVEAKDIFGEGSEEVGEGVEASAGDEEEKFANSDSSTNFWMLARSGYWCRLLDARRCGSCKGEGPGGGGCKEGRANILGGIIPNCGGKHGGAPALMAF